jgi:IS30 family transposase
MSKSYQQLTEEERIEIYAMKQAGKSLPKIAKALGRSTSTISRELNRNTGQRGYRPKQAHRLATERRESTQRPSKMTNTTIGYIHDKLAIEWSPEEISGTMKNDPDYTGIPVSHERIYQYIWKDKRDGGALYKQLRIGNKEKYRKRYGTNDYRGKIPNRKDIDERPSIVEEKTRIGDWEADLVVGAGSSGYLVTLVDRVSKLTLIGHVRYKTSALVTEEILRLMRPHKNYVHTVTFDNGREFSGHEMISSEFKCGCYFAKPYHSWERGLNENTNGLIRQYFPKKEPFINVTSSRIQLVMDRLNSRPRKLLDYVTPAKIYYGITKLAA